MRQDALSKLSTLLDEEYDNYIKELAMNFDKAKDAVVTTEANLENYLTDALATLENNIMLYSTNLTTEMLLGIDSIINGVKGDMDSLQSEDLKITKEAEAKKANKLNQYENAKLNALTTFDQDVKNRQDALKKLLENLKAQDKTESDNVNSYLSQIISDNQLTKAAIDGVMTAVNSAGGTIVSTGTSIEKAVADAAAEFSKSDNPINKALTDTLGAMKSVNEKWDALNSEPHLKDIYEQALKDAQSYEGLMNFLKDGTVTALDFETYKTSVLDALGKIVQNTNPEKEYDPLKDSSVAPTTPTITSGTGGSTGGGSSSGGYGNKSYTVTSGKWAWAGSNNPTKNRTYDDFSNLTEGDYHLNGVSRSQDNQWYYGIAKGGKYDGSPYTVAYMSESTMKKLGLNINAKGGDVEFSVNSKHQLINDKVTVSNPIQAINGGKPITHLVTSGQVPGLLRSYDDFSKLSPGDYHLAGDIIDKKGNKYYFINYGKNGLNDSGDTKIMLSQSTYDKLGLGQLSENYGKESFSINSNHQLVRDNVTVTSTKNAGINLPSDLSSDRLTRSDNISPGFYYVGSRYVANGEYYRLLFTKGENGYLLLQGAKIKESLLTNNGISTDILTRFLVDNDYTLKKYAKGTFNASKGLAEVFEEGPEIITTARGTFVPFEGGEGVVPAEQTRTLMNLAKAFNKGLLQAQMPNMGYQVPVNTNTHVNTTNNVSFDSLITINGNANADTVGEIKQIAQQLVSNKQFQENVTQFVSKRQAQDGRMAGKRVSVI